MKTVTSDEGVFVAVPAPSGRTSFEGTIVSVREYENLYSVTANLVMHVVVTTSQGCWFCFCTVPRSLRVAAHKECGLGGPAEWLVGKKVALTATLFPRREESHIAVGKHPAKARLV